MNPSFLFHAAQALLAPVSIWATAENGVLVGASILAIIGMMELGDMLFAENNIITHHHRGGFA